jgi:hypothetical protein
MHSCNSHHAVCMRQPFSILLFPFCFKAVPSDLIQQVQRLWECRKHWQTLDLGLESTSCNCSWIMIVRNLHPTNANFRVWKIKMYCRSCEVFLKLPIHAGTMLHVLVRHRWVTYFGSLPHVQLTCQDTVTWYRWDCYLMNQVAERQICLREQLHDFCHIFSCFI